MCQIEKALNENLIFNKIGQTARLELAKCGFIKSYEPNKVIVTEGQDSSHMYLIETGILSLQTTIEKSKLTPNSIDFQLLPYFNKKEEKTKLQVFEKGIGEVICDYEIMFKEKSRYTIITMTNVTLVIFSEQDILRIMSSDDILILKKNIFVPPSKEKIMGHYLTSIYFENFKRKILKEEHVYDKFKKEGRLQLPKSNHFSSFQNTQSHVNKQGNTANAFQFLKLKGINNINNEAICNPKSL